MEKSKKIRMSPAARKLAKQMGINVGELQADGIIRSKDILSAQAQNEAYNNEILQDYNDAVAKTSEDLTQRYSDILVLERKNRSAAAWQDLKESQDALLCAYLDECKEKAACKKALDRRCCAKNKWQEAAQEQTYALNAFLAGKARESRRTQATLDWKAAKEAQTDFANEFLSGKAAEKRRQNAYDAWKCSKTTQTEKTNEFLAAYNAQKRKDDAYAYWKKAKAEQTKATNAFIDNYYEASAAVNRENRMKAAYNSWLAMKAAQTECTEAFLQAVEDEKARLRAQERKAAAKASWEALKEDSDAKLEEFMQQYEEAQYEKAYTEYVASLDEFNQVSVGKLEFDTDVIEDAVEDSEMPFNDALTRYVASAVAKALVDLECPIYENGIMNIISLTGAKPIKTVTNAHEGDFMDLVYEDAVYFSKDIKVRIWDISVCGLESFFASQGGINVYINIDDDEVDLDVAIDTSVMMDLEALIFLMRMKEYLSGNEEDDEEEEDEE
ncbi:MAG: hypothetical protein E7218_02990 [Anaerofustis stercorihominis]|nr:hypothetical protein [Anaerofustis stercorihominis]